MIDLYKLSEECFILKQKRSSSFPKNDTTLKHLATEIVELVEAVSSQSDNIGEELADVVICCLTASKELNIDLEKEINQKIQKNKIRAEKGV